MRRRGTGRRVFSAQRLAQLIPDSTLHIARIVDDVNLDPAHCRLLPRLTVALLIAARVVERSVRNGRHLHRCAVGRGMHHHPVTDIDAGMRNIGVEGHNVPRLQV